MARLLWVRPFPAMTCGRRCAGVKAVGVVETNLGLGGASYGGILSLDVTTALYQADYDRPRSPRSWPAWAGKPCRSRSSTGWPGSWARRCAAAACEKATHWVGFEE